MSAWIVTENHIDALVEWGIRTGLINTPEADTAGRKLWAENLASVAYRYPHDGDGERPGPTGFRDADVTTYVWSAAKPTLPDMGYAGFDPNDPEHALQQVGCYTYQSCEHEDWDGSWAKSYCDALVAALKPLAAKAHRHPKRAKAEIPWGI